MTNKNNHSVFIKLFFITIIGYLIRSSIVNSSDFPINDGGMFYSIIRDVRESNFTLPQYISYNLTSTPFAYPPLGFYIGAFLVQVFSISEIDVLRFFPMICSTLAIPLLYFLYRGLRFSIQQAIVAVGIYVLMPAGYFWFIMGGGLTRSLGLLFSLLSIIVGSRFLKKNDKVMGVFLSIFLGLTILSHLELAIFSIGTLFLVWAVFEKKFSTFVWLLLCFSIALFLTSFWWVKVLSLHGLGVYSTVFFNGFHFPNILLPLMKSNDMTHPPYQIIDAFSFFIILIFTYLVDKSKILFYWALFILFILSRSEANYITIPLSIGISVIAIKILNKVSLKLSLIKFSLNIPQMVLATLLLFSIFQKSFWRTSDDKIYLKSLEKNDRIAMNWVKNNTETDSNFILITHLSTFYWMGDSIKEWFPALAERHSLTTIQSSEWYGFNDLIKENEALDYCIENIDLHCIEQWAKDRDKEYSHIWLTKRYNRSSWHQQLAITIEKSKQYNLVFSNEKVSIWEKI